MIVERVHNGFLVAPDFKFTGDRSPKSSGLAGGYAGFVIDDQFFIGGGGYGLATDRRGRDLAYGGFVLQWLVGGNDTFGFSAKTLLGGGSAETSGTVQVVDRGRVISEPFRSRQDFFVAEPELDALVRSRATSGWPSAPATGSPGRPPWQNDDVVRRPRPHRPRRRGRQHLGCKSAAAANGGEEKGKEKRKERATLLRL